jgi:hypothetical protein
MLQECDHHLLEALTRLRLLAWFCFANFDIGILSHIVPAYRFTIGLNAGDLKVIAHFHVFDLGLILCSHVPKFEYVSNAKPIIFVYPPSVKQPKKETVAKVATAVLSTTAKVKAREKKKAAAEDLVRK